MTPMESIRLEALKLALEKNPGHNTTMILDKADAYEEYIRDGKKPKSTPVIKDRFRVFTAGEVSVEVGMALVMDDGQTLLQIQEPFSTDLQRQIVQGFARGLTVGLSNISAVPANPAS